MELKKCIVLDLDNTLWGGIVGEDGFEGLLLGLTAPGNGFLAFQQALLDLYNRGVLLAINSRNNPEDAFKVIREHPNMILKQDHFAAYRINWADKAQNIRELAHELNIGLDSMVFLDDDPLNRELVRATVPAVEVPDLPQDPAEYARFLIALPYFPHTATTAEDAMRGNLYVTERLRKAAEQSFATKEEFLKDLGLQLSMYEDDMSCVPRLSQLTEKTNQFNIDKQPLTEAQVAERIAGDSHRVFHAQLTDRFGDHGVILLAIVGKRGTVWHIEQLLMSCRVFGRGVESVFLAWLAERARQAGADVLTIAYRETEKNIPARDFIAAYFDDRSLDVSRAPRAPEWISVQTI